MAYYNVKSFYLQHLRYLIFWCIWGVILSFGMIPNGVILTIGVMFCFGAVPDENNLIFGWNGTGATRHGWIYCIRSNLFPAFNLQHFLLPQTPGLRPQSRQQATNEIWMKEGKCDWCIANGLPVLFLSVWLWQGCVTDCQEFIETRFEQDQTTIDGSTMTGEISSQFRELHISTSISASITFRG